MMKKIAIIILTICISSCSNCYKTMYFITRYDYETKQDNGWIVKTISLSQLTYIKDKDSSVVKLIEVNKDYSEILFKKYIIKNEILVKRIDSTLKDTICPYIRHVNSFQDDTTNYIYFTIKAKTHKNVITNYKDFQFRGLQMPPKR